MGSLDVCNAAVRVIDHYVIDDEMDFVDGINEVGAYLIDSENPDAGYRVEVSYGDVDSPHPPRCAPVISERLARAGLADVPVIYIADSPTALQ